mgnify:CR=1 FL=1
MTQLVHGNSELRLAMNGLGSNICLVPTMGALHDGHAALIAAGKEFVGKDGCVVVSDFVNPKHISTHSSARISINFASYGILMIVTF